MKSSTKALYAVLVTLIIGFIPLPIRGQLNCSGGPCSYLSGTAALPSLFGQSFATTGLYWASNLLGVAVNGAAAAQFAPSTGTMGGTSGYNLILGQTPSGNFTSYIRFLSSNSAYNWKLSNNDSVADAFELAASTVGGGSTFAAPKFTWTQDGTSTGVTVVSGATSTVTITTAKLQMRGSTVLSDGLPTCSGAGCVMGATSTNTAMNFTTTTTGAADITVTFSAAFSNAPSCFANNDTTGNLLRVTTVVVGSIHVQGVTVAGDTLRVGCFGN